MKTNVRAAVTLGVFFVMGGAIACNHWSLKSDPRANDAVLALKRLQARLDTGITFPDYSSAVGDTNFAVKQFLESDKGNSEPEFSRSLRNSMRWYTAAGQIWSRQLSAPGALGYCASTGFPNFHVQDLCDTYPELVTNVPGEVPGSDVSPQFAAAFVRLQIIATAYSDQSGKDDSKRSPGLIYELAIKESWRRAEFETKNAQHCISSEKLEQADDKSFRADRHSEMTYLVEQAQRR